MKELKAVSYLRKIKEYYSVSFSDEAIQNIDEALAELAELMQEKSCEGCVEEYRKKSGLENYKNFGLEKSILVFPCNVCQRMATDYYAPEDKK